MRQDLIFKAINGLVDTNEHPFCVKKDGTVVWTNEGKPPVTQEEIKAAIDKIQLEQKINAAKAKTKKQILDKKNVGPLESQATAGAALALMFNKRLCTIEQHLGIEPTISEKEALNLQKMKLLLDLHGQGKVAQEEIKNG